MELTLNTHDIRDYHRFLAIKRLPAYRIHGSTAWFPDEYAARVGVDIPVAAQRQTYAAAVPTLFDYQRDIAGLAIRKRKFGIFADPGLGKTLMFCEYARHVYEHELPKDKRILIISPPMVVRQTLDEIERFYGNSLPVVRIEARELASWLTMSDEGFRIGITNYEALRTTTPQGNLGALILDESSMLKSMYGKWGATCIRLGKGIDWKLCATGTPAPNDRIEYGNHAVFLDQFPTLNAFLAKYFVNRGQTSERWELKPHALQPFYRALSHWCIFLTNPATYGWRDNCDVIPPINVHVHDVDLTAAQREAVRETTGQLFVTDTPGGIGKRSALGQIGKGSFRGQRIGTLKNKYIRDLVATWSESAVGAAAAESTLIWCLYNEEQDAIAREFPDAANIDGRTPLHVRLQLIDDFKMGRRRVMISKPKILGFGLNLQIATRQVFSGLQDSYESYYQAIKRSNRYGSTRPLNVHIPVTEVERPMIETVLRKAKMVQQDTEAQERFFKSIRDGSVDNNGKGKS